MSNIVTPEWVKHAVFYQIFPDRFARSEWSMSKNGLQFKNWGSPPEEQGFQGGDLYGIIEKLDYLEDLGINAIYLNPIFSSASNHRYHTYDYFQVDPLLGGNQAFRKLLEAAHAKDIRIILDGVFNHASRGFWAFHHILENEFNSPYLDWFHIHGTPLRPYSSDYQHPANYDAWWGIPALPKFNTDNPAVREYIFDVARYWIEQGADGWRLDVPAEIDDDDFWRSFRNVVKAANPDAYIVGEIWHEARRWLQGDQFDGVMNYYFGQALIGFFAAHTLQPNMEHDEFNHIRPMDAISFAHRIEEILGWYDWQINLTQLNQIDSHDTPRMLWMMGNDRSALRLAALFQLTMPGTPVIYYGTEVGLSSRGDPFCRGAYPWGQESPDDLALRNFYKRAIDLRRSHAVLRTGRIEFVFSDHDKVVFRRNLENAEAVVAFNSGRSDARISLPEDRLSASAYYRIWPDNKGQIVGFEDGQLSIDIAARSGVVLINQS